MSIPKREPDFTVEDLQEVGGRFLDVGYEYWEAMHKAGNGGATVWLDDTDGGMVVFTRGEYRETLLRNIERLGNVTVFGRATDGTQQEAPPNE